MSDHAATPAQHAFTADLGHRLRVPQSVELGPLAGRGKRSITFRATCGGEQVALKVYRRKFIDKYRQLATSELDNLDEKLACIGPDESELQTVMNLSTVRTDAGEFLYSVLQIQDVTESLELTVKLE